MKPKARLRAKQQKDKLHKFMISVNNYVKSQAGSEDTERFERMGGFVKKKSRKELRREKRKAKKAKLRNRGNAGDSERSEEPELSKKKTQRSEEPELSKKKTQRSEEPELSKKKTQRSEEPELSKKKKKSALKERGSEQSRAPESRSERAAEEKPKRKVHFDDTVQQQSKKAKLDMARRRALLEANEAEDKEIKKLEKRLGLNKRKNKRSLPQSFINDGLDYILGILEPGVSEALLGDEEEKSELERLEELSDSEEEEEDGSDEERAGAERDVEAEEAEEGNEDVNEEEEDDDDDDEIEDEEEEKDDDGDQGEEEVDDEEEEKEDVPEDESVNSDGEEGTSEDKPTDSKQPDTDTVGKYVPPHLREAADSKRKAELERLKRNLKGLINRLSEPNMGSICGQIEEMYMSCSRKDMNDTLTELLLAACVTPTLMPDRLLMEHVLLLSVLHHTVGLEVGAHFLETVVRRFDDSYLRSSEAGKESENLALMVAHLYNFHVVHALLLFDLLKRLVSSFTARDVELVLLLLKNVGFALRKDDPLALKDLITEAQRKASTEGQRLSDQTRVRFMLETMLALKNNDMRKIPGYDPEPVERLRKLQRTLVHHRASGTDLKLRVSLENLLEAERVGRWWIVGSSWSGAPMIGDQGNKTTPQPAKGEQFSAKVLELARKQRMNTDIRRNIFCVIMTSEDYLDAFEKLLRLGLKGQQERDIVHVLLDCCLQEKNFNGFYAVLAEKFCAHDRRFQMTVQFCLWDKFKELASLSSSSFSNLVQMVTHLLRKNSLSLSILKAIEFGELDKPKVKFLKQILSKLLQQTEPEDLVQIFGRISGIPKLEMLREGLKLFIRHFLLRSAQTQGPAEQTTLLTERAEIATKAMEARDAKLKL
ncbi:LOW QUALITY PROTEIN: nucleolar MIF4G domain-containing protein 1 [Colossoma macropomum]|uniref:LOW QUALITY PROTEIN: nucleolar MIF4G domain-containing protein 1 n=1 Tax=Colossoma macropomum TaxID=42526 RepID=UPI001863CF23|nr:LOW QUALITY PROTEIN: nucleolar MIF4G domain-containing protein 1 [Colossoma macropomum]